jgi:hypothetical protein
MDPQQDYKETNSKYESIKLSVNQISEMLKKNWFVDGATVIFCSDDYQTPT